MVAGTGNRCDITVTKMQLGILERLHMGVISSQSLMCRSKCMILVGSNSAVAVPRHNFLLFSFWRSGVCRDEYYCPFMSGGTSTDQRNRATFVVSPHKQCLSTTYDTHPAQQDTVRQTGMSLQVETTCHTQHGTTQ